MELNEIWQKAEHLQEDPEAEAKLREIREAFNQSDLGRQYNDTFEQLEKANRDSFLSEYRNVPRALKTSFIRDYRDLMKEILKEQFKKYPYKNSMPWEVPVEHLLRYISFQTTKDIIEALAYDLIVVYEGHYDLDEFYRDEDEEDEVESEFENQIPTSHSISSKGRKAISIRFNTLFHQPQSKKDLKDRLQQIEVLNEYGFWKAGICNSKGSRPLYEALVRLGIMKRQMNVAAVFRAFQEEFNITETKRNFSNPPSEELTVAYIEELKKLKR